MADKTLEEVKKVILTENENALVAAMNAVSFRLFVLEKLLVELHGKNYLDKLVKKLEKEINDEFQKGPNTEVQDKEERAEGPSNDSGESASN